MKIEWKSVDGKRHFYPRNLNMQRFTFHKHQFDPAAIVVFHADSNDTATESEIDAIVQRLNDHEARLADNQPPTPRQEEISESIGGA